MDWTPVRESVKKHGMRNSNTMAIAPTATISNITGSHPIDRADVQTSLCEIESLRRIYNPQPLPRRKTQKAWTFGMKRCSTISNISMDRSLKSSGFPKMSNRSILTAFEIDPEWIIECASRRQKWIDMGQSLNLYLAEPSGKKLHQMYMLSWEKGLKTTYYLRCARCHPD